MIPNLFRKENLFASSSLPLVGTTTGVIFSDPNTLNNASSSLLPADMNVESIIQGHRRKMLRRAANRRSAQLSRARKKAHMEELKNENSRLQRILDVLDSQPEIVLCITACGKITYISENSMHFVKLKMNGSEGEEDPTHINQVLLPESVKELLLLVQNLHLLSSKNPQEEHGHSIFFSKKVRGMLRCAKVNRRASLSDLATNPIEQHLNSVSTTPSAQLLQHQHNSSDHIPPTPYSTLSSSSSKKQKLSNKIQSKNPSSQAHQAPQQSKTVKEVNLSSESVGEEPWNHLSILADCVVTSLSTSTEPNSNSDPATMTKFITSLHTNISPASDPSSSTKVVIEVDGEQPCNNFDHHKTTMMIENHDRAVVSKESNRHEDNQYAKNNLNISYEPTALVEEEYVCVIRISENAFLPYQQHNNNVMSRSISNDHVCVDVHEHKITPFQDQNSNKDSNNKNTMYYVFASAHLLSSHQHPQIDTSNPRTLNNSSINYFDGVNIDNNHNDGIASCSQRSVSGTTTISTSHNCSSGSSMNNSNSNSNNNSISNSISNSNDPSDNSSDDNVFEQ